MARGQNPDDAKRVSSKEKTDFSEGKVGAGADQGGRARAGFGPKGLGKGPGMIVGTKAGYKGGR